MIQRRRVVTPQRLQITHDPHAIKPAPFLLNHELLRDEVCIVAPGPNGTPYFSDVKGVSVACNYAIAIPGLDPTFWFVGDATVQGVFWWNEDLFNIDTIRCFSYELQKVLPVHLREKVDFTYKDPDIVPGEGLEKVHNGSTVVGHVIRYLYAYTRVRRIVLCGVDMIGNTFYDGSYRDNYNDESRVNIQRHALQYLIDRVVRCGVTVESLSPTALKVPLV